MIRLNHKKYMMLILILGISIGFAVLTASLSILGTANVKKREWDIHWDNVNILPGSVDVEEPSIDEDRDTVTWVANLDLPGDTLSFTVDAVNDGDLDAKITNLVSLVYNSNDETTPITLPDYIEYSVTYSDGAPIKNNQLLKGGEKETYLVTVKYNEDIITSSDVSILFKLSLDYIMDDGTGEEVLRGDNSCYDNVDLVVPEGTVCKRAEELHQEECTREIDGCYSVGYALDGTKGTTTITYGTCGRLGSAPVAGDAFDCDVDGNGTFDDDERFYYISDTGSNEGYATLIYYKNVGTSAYNSSGDNFNGPTTLLNTLPSTSEWSNAGLNTNMTRQIKNELGTNTSDNGSKTLPNYTYTGKSARLLSVQEVNSACGITAGRSNIDELATCQYLLENTYYAANDDALYWWLETPRSLEYYGIWGVRSDSNYVYDYFANETYGVRPAIEVDKTKIAY